MESGSRLSEIRDGEKIRKIFKQLISGEEDINVLFPGDPTQYLSRVIHLDAGREGSGAEGKSRLILDKLFPEEGNRVIKANDHLTLEFVVKTNVCRGRVRYLGISTRYPHFGFALGLPRSLEIAERRREVRHTYEAPDFVSVEFSVKGGSRVYALGVRDCSLHGLGILIGEQDLDLLDLLKPGDRIEGITFYSESTIIKVDGIVRHITPIKTGDHQGSYVLGVESPGIIENCRTVSF